MRIGGDTTLSVFFYYICGAATDAQRAGVQSDHSHQQFINSYVYYTLVFFILVGVLRQHPRLGSGHQHAEIPVHSSLCANSPQDLE